MLFKCANKILQGMLVYLSHSLFGLLHLLHEFNISDVAFLQILQLRLDFGAAPEKDNELIQGFKALKTLGENFLQAIHIYRLAYYI